LMSLGLPWVAQRVWPMPSCPLGQRPPTAVASVSSLPTRLWIDRSPFVSSTAMPALS
jgi:hypothetical protein